MRWNGAEVTRAGIPDRLAHVGALAMVRDRDENIWIGTTSGHLLRVNRHGVVSIDERDRGRRGAVTSVFEDRDRNLWIGTNRGIERLRDGVFTTYSAAQGLPVDASGPVYVDDTRTWIAPVDGGLYTIAGQRVTPVTIAGLANDVVYSISGGAGDVWLARQRGGLTRLQADGDTFSARTYTKKDGLAQDNVYAVLRAQDGTVWAGTLSGGLSRFKDGRFTTFTTEDGLASNTVTALAEAADRSIWVATPNGVSRQLNDRLGSVVYRRGAAVERRQHVVRRFCARHVDRHIGRSRAGARRAHRKEHSRRPSPCAGRFSGWPRIEPADCGWRRTSGSSGSAGRRLAANNVSPADLREFGASDGLLGVEGVKRHRSVATDSAGRVWLSTTRGLSMTNPTAPSDWPRGRSSAIETVSADGVPIVGPLTIPPRKQRIAFSFTGLSLATPERVQFQYRLDDFDRDWSAPTLTRQAVYTNLGPGDYRFHVRASNGEGAWNGDEAVVSLSIAPAFWQTVWFRALLLVVASVAAWAAYRLQLHQVRRQLNVRFEERLAERTRIAQELHDTLLQGFLSASMQLHVAADRLPPDSPAKSSLKKVQDLMTRVIEEGRNAVRGLRSTGGVTDDLPRAFSGMSGRTQRRQRHRIPRSRRGTRSAAAAVDP